MYEPWQNYGNQEGIRADDRPPGGLKREREDLGGDDQAFKQGRIMGPGNMGYGGGGGMGGYPSSNVPMRPGENPGFTALSPGPNQTLGAGNPALGHPPGPAAGANFPGSQLGRSGFVGQGPQGMPPQAVSGPPAMQAYPQSGSLGFNTTSQGFNLNPAQRQGQGSYNQEAGPSGQQGSQYGRPQAGPPPHGPSQVGAAPQNAQYAPSNGPAYQPGPTGSTFGAPQAAPQLYDPQHPQLGGGQPPPQQQQQQQLTQPEPQQLASLASALQSLSQQQPGFPSLNLGSLLSQGGAAHLQPQQQNTPQQPYNAQMQVLPQTQQPQLMGGVPHGQPQIMPVARQEAIPVGGIEQLPQEAAETLYVDNMTMDVTRREMSHIFRPFEGFKDMRIVEKKDKHGSPLVIGFAEFETAHQANAALKVLQAYPLDMNKPQESQLRISFAKPLKASDPRSRGQPVNRSYQPAGNVAPNRPNDRGNRGGNVGNPTGPRNDRDRRDGDRGGLRGQGRDRKPDDRRPAQDNRRRY